MAEIMFSELGLSGARLEGIAQEVGISRASVLHYFSSKQEIYDCVEADIYEGMNSELDKRVDQKLPPFERLLQVIDAELDFMVVRPTAARIIQRNAADRTARISDPLKYSSRIVDCYEKIAQEGYQSGRFIERSLFLIINILGGSILHYVCNVDQLGASRAYAADDPEGLSQFRQTLHRAAGAILLKE